MFKFKGTTLRGEVVFGEYFKGSIYDKEGNFHEVDPKTVGLFIGLKDKHGLEVCSGDELVDKHRCKYKVIYDTNRAGYKLQPLDKTNMNSFTSFNIESVRLMEICND